MKLKAIPEENMMLLASRHIVIIGDCFCCVKEYRNDDKQSEWMRMNKTCLI
ncbi:hypothetical protein SAMN04487770_11274 [Butyrivibrio sp. ob235]|nr:hypothetical protein SAMN04487770_11274 [Butyrivibrio sp. ob235]